MKTGRRRMKPSAGFVPLRDLVPRSDPKGGAAQKAVFGERPPVTEDKEQSREIPVEQRLASVQDHARKRKKGETT
jgi:hypothetical protein